MKYFEDFAAGDVVDLGAIDVGEEELLEFGRRFDPQPFHTDLEAGRASIFGGVIASGAHTFALFARLFALGVLNGSAGMGSPGLEELRWLHPGAPRRRGSLLSPPTRPNSATRSWRRRRRRATPPAGPCAGGGSS